MAYYVVTDTAGDDDPHTLAQAGNADVARNQVIAAAIANLKVRFTARLATPADLLKAGREHWPTVGIEDPAEPPESIRAQSSMDLTMAEDDAGQPR
jgi:hypothetical protein